MAKRGFAHKRLDWITSVIVIAAVLFLAVASRGGGDGFAAGWVHLKDGITSFADELWSDIPNLADEPEPGPDASADSEWLLRVHFIDVGQGKSILIEAPEKTVLIDAGENDQGEVVLRYLARQRIKSLDIAVGTHPHSDHIGGLDTVILSMPVDKVILPVISDELSPTTPTYIDLLEAIAAKGLKITTAKPGDEYGLGGGAALKILGPVRNDYPSLNDFSVVSRLDYGSTSFLFTGDATSSAEKDLLGSGVKLRANVLDLGHHGSRDSTSKGFLEAVRPRIAVISCGLDNSYGHPHRQVMERLEEPGYMEVFRTDLDGAVVISSNGKSLSHKTGKQ